MIEDELAQWLADHQITWNIKGGEPIIPDSDDVAAALDEAARLLYDEPVDAQLEIGKMIVVKKHQGFDVYVLAGDYL